MTKRYKAGVIGLGFIGPAHMEGIRRLGYEVLGIAEQDQNIANDKAAQLFVPKAYGNYIDLINDPEIDVIHVTSPNHLHFAHVKAAISAGKHVICEKPLALEAQEALELVNLAKQKGVVNAVNFNIRFYPLIQEARSRIISGELGENIYIVQGSYLQDWLLLDTDWNWRLESEYGGPSRAVADIGSHWIDLVTFLTGLKIKSVFADFKTFLPIRKKPKKALDTFSGKMESTQEYDDKQITTEDYAAVIFKFENNAHGLMSVSQVSSGRKNRLSFEINGSKSSLIWNSKNPNTLIIGHRTKPNEYIIKDPALMSNTSRWAASYPGGHAEGFPDTFKQLQSSVYQYIAKGDFSVKPDFPTFEDGYRISLINEAILKSAKENKWIEITK